MNQKEDNYQFYLSSLQESWKLLTHNLTLYIPDLLFILFLTFFLWLFLQFNGLLTPLLQINRLQATQEAFRTILQSTPSLLKLILSSTLLLFVHLCTGITFVNARYILIKQSLTHQKLSLLNAFKEGKTYFWKVVFIKFLFFFLYLLPSLIFLFIYILTHIQNPFFLSLLLTLLAILWFAIKYLFFFTYPTLFLKEKNYKAAFNATHYSQKKITHTLITLGTVTFLSFFINLLLLLIPEVWFRIAFSAHILSTTATFAFFFLIFSRTVHLVYTIFESSFIFHVYSKNK